MAISNREGNLYKVTKTTENQIFKLKNIDLKAILYGHFNGDCAFEAKAFSKFMHEKYLEKIPLSPVVSICLRFFNAKDYEFI